MIERVVSLPPWISGAACGGPLTSRCVSPCVVDGRIGCGCGSAIFPRREFSSLLSTVINWLICIRVCICISMRNSDIGVIYSARIAQLSADWNIANKARLF